MKKAVSAKTEKVLRKVIAYLEEEPKRLEMHHWGQIFPESDTEVYVGDTYKEEYQPLPPCKTAACVAGTCLLVTKAGKDFLKEYGAVKVAGQEETVEFPNHTPVKAASILGLEEEKAAGLFYFKEWGHEHGWPEKFSRRYTKAKTPRGRFLAAKARIEHFIQTGK